MRLSEFETKATKAEPAPIYVFAGSDPYLLDRARAVVRARVLGDADLGMALAEFEGDAAEPADVLDALRTPPLVAPRGLVVVRQADGFVSAARALLEKLLDTPPDSGSLVLEVGSWNRSTRLGKRTDAIGFLVQCEVDKPEHLVGWIGREAKSRFGKSVTPPAARLLTESLGADMGALIGALERLDLYTGDRTQIGEADVDAVVARGHHEQVWALSDAIVERNLPRALELLDAFWADGMAAPQLVGLLRYQVRQMLSVAALAARMSVDQAMREARVPRPAARRIRAALPGLTLDHLADAYQALVDADLEAKSSRNDRLAMEVLVHRLCRPAAPAAR